jgi:hypothetical protein
MQQDTLAKVLNEVCQDLENIKKQNQENVKHVKHVIERLDGIDNKFSSIKVEAEPVDLLPMEQLILKSIADITTNINAQPKPIVREFHFHFFPKMNIKEYYQTYSKLVLYLILLTLTFCFVDVCVEGIEGYNQRQEERLHVLQLQKQYEASPSKESVKIKAIQAAQPNDTIHVKQKQKYNGIKKTAGTRNITTDSLKKEVNKFLQGNLKDTAQNK